MHDHKVDKTRGEFQKLLASDQADAEGWYQFAQFEHRAAHAEDAPDRYNFDATRSALENALSLNENHVLANVLMGDLLLEPFDHTENPDPEGWNAARKYYQIANRIDPLHPLPLFRFASTYLRAGEQHPQVGSALEEAFYGAPESQELRFALASHHVGEGEYDKAVNLLKVIAGSPHSGQGARQFIEQINAMRDGTISELTPEIIETSEDDALDDGADADADEPAAQSAS